MATPVTAGSQTVAFIRTTVRELCGSPSENQLTTAYIDQTLNNFYASDFPYAIKLDQMRSVYTFYTQPYQSYYPLDVNYNQGVKDPVYFDGVQGTFYKDRRDFFALWPRWPSFFNNIGQSSPMGGILGITQSSPGVATVTIVPNSNLVSNNTVYITGVNGITNINGNSYVITVISSSSFTIPLSISGSYTSGGSWYVTPVNFSFTIQGPFLQNEVTIGGNDINGNFFIINDDSQGYLYQQTPNGVTSVPPYSTNPAVPGMYNRNTGNPGLLNPTYVGTVNYVTGNFNFNLPLPLEAGTTLSVRVSQYEPGRPYSLLFWNNYFIVRPTPKYIHKVEVETYLTPVQFMESSDQPILLQWAQYLSYGTACEILRRRQDTAGLANIMEGFKRQEQLVLERQGTEEINQRNANIFSQSTPNQGWGNGVWGGWGY